MKLKFKVILGFFIFIVAILFFSFFKGQYIFAPQIDQIFQTGQNVLNSDLDKVVGKSFEGTEGTYGITIKNLKTGKSYFLNEHKQFEAASLYKIWVMATAFNQIEQGKLKEGEMLSQDVLTLNKKFNIASEAAELTEGTVTFTTLEAINQMITISHNYAALLLSERIRLNNVADFLKANSLTESSIGQPPQTTANDVVLFFEKLYKEELGNKDSTAKMLDILKNQQLNEGLPKYLPKNTLVAHKTGDLGLFKHDAGIVFSEKGDYIIVVMSESSSPLGAQERIAQISKAVYDYFQKN
jgi:beta-lactamase class A